LINLNLTVAYTSEFINLVAWWLLKEASPIG